MYTYSLCGLTLASNIPLPELIPATRDVVDCEFCLMSSGPFPPEEIEWFHSWTIEAEEGENESEQSPWVRFARQPDGYLLRFPSCGDFHVSGDVTEIECRPLPDIPAVTVRHLLLDQVVPLVLSRKDLAVFHASAVSTEWGAIAFAGQSGRGKSTIALALAQHGHTLLTDDCLALRGAGENWMVLPTYPGVRVWESTAQELLRQNAAIAEVAHYTSKQRIVDIDGMSFSAHPQPIRRLFVLGEDESEISINKLESSRAFMAWAEFAYNLDIVHADYLRGHFEVIGKLASEVSAYALNYPREYNVLPAVESAIFEHLKETCNDHQ